MRGLAVGRTGPRRPSRRQLVLAVVGLVLLAATAVLVTVDQRRLQRETTGVATCLTRGEEAALFADRRLSAMVGYLAPARAREYEGSVDAVDRLVSELMARAANDARVPVAEAAQRCERLAVRRWHPGTDAARDNVVSYLRARLDSLDAIVADPDAYGQGDDELARLRERAFPSGAPRAAA